MQHARHRAPQSRRPAAFPALVFTLTVSAFAGLAALPATAHTPPPDLLVWADVAPVPPPVRSTDLPRASRERGTYAAPGSRPTPTPTPTPTPAPAPLPEPKPEPAVVKAAPPPPPAPKPVATRLRKDAPARSVAGRCPVPSASFTDTWGAARSGGRSHQGTDLMAAHGEPVYAVASGAVDTASSSNGGISLYLRAENGERYFYAHNSANVVGDGARVEAGELIARVGSSGNASSSAPHVHFERQVGGRSVNPYAFLRSLC